MGEGGSNHQPLQRSGADRKRPHTQATSSTHGAWKRETRQPITEKPHSSPENSRGMPRVEPRNQGWRARAPQGTDRPKWVECVNKSSACPRTTPPPSRGPSQTFAPSGPAPTLMPKTKCPQNQRHELPFCYQVYYLGFLYRFWKATYWIHNRHPQNEKMS